MTDEEAKKYFSRNLKHLMETHDKTQTQISNDLHIALTTVNNWVHGVAVPRVGTMQKVAHYFGVEWTDMIAEHMDDEKYYDDSETKELANFLYHNPEYRVLFDASRNVKREDIDFVRQMIERMSKQDGD